MSNHQRLTLLAVLFSQLILQKNVWALTTMLISIPGHIGQLASHLLALLLIGLDFIYIPLSILTVLAFAHDVRVQTAAPRC